MFGPMVFTLFDGLKKIVKSKRKKPIILSSNNFLVHFYVKVYATFLDTFFVINFVVQGDGHQFVCDGLPFFFFLFRLDMPTLL